MPALHDDQAKTVLGLVGARRPAQGRAALDCSPPPGDCRLHRRQAGPPLFGRGAPAVIIEKARQRIRQQPGRYQGSVAPDPARWAAGRRDAAARRSSSARSISSVGLAPTGCDGDRARPCTTIWCTWARPISAGPRPMATRPRRALVRQPVPRWQFAPGAGARRDHRRGCDFARAREQPAGNHSRRLVLPTVWQAHARGRPSDACWRIS